MTSDAQSCVSISLALPAPSIPSPSALHLGLALSLLSSPQCLMVWWLQRNFLGMSTEHWPGPEPITRTAARDLGREKGSEPPCLLPLVLNASWDSLQALQGALQEPSRDPICVFKHCLGPLPFPSSRNTASIFRLHCKRDPGIQARDHGS